MCYSAQIRQDYRHYLGHYGADVDIAAFAALYLARRSDPTIKLPKAMDLGFANAHDQHPGLARIRELIAEHDAAQAAALEQTLFAQRRRLADAQRKLQAKPTKAAERDRRIATDKIEWARGKLSDLRRSEALDRDACIFPRHYAPVMVMEQGRRVVRPMRYQCRPAGRPANYDTRYPGTYNARRDNLEEFWKDMFGVSHGIAVVTAFFENVSRSRLEGCEPTSDEKDQNIVLEFRPDPPGDMLVACLWSHWRAPGQPELLSFAAITDTPPPEIAAAGHDRCVIPIKPEYIDAWLHPRPGDLESIRAILEDRQRPYYEHRMAA